MEPDLGSGGLSLMFEMMDVSFVSTSRSRWSRTPPPPCRLRPPTAQPVWGSFLLGQAFTALSPRTFARRRYQNTRGHMSRGWQFGMKDDDDDEEELMLRQRLCSHQVEVSNPQPPDSTSLSS